MSIFGSRSDPAKEQETWRKLEMLRATLLMAGQSKDESRKLEIKMLQMTLEDALALGHHCRAILVASDGRMWMAHGELTGKLAEEARKMPETKRALLEQELKNVGLANDDGLADIDAINGVIRKAWHRLRVDIPLPGNPFPLNRHGCRFGEALPGGPREWVVDERIVKGKDGKLGCKALFWLALRERGVSEQLADFFVDEFVKS